jgi:hypothetical protein
MLASLTTHPSMPCITHPDLLDTANVNQSDLLAHKKITLALIASNEARFVDICATLVSSKPSLKCKKSDRSSAKALCNDGRSSPLLLTLTLSQALYWLLVNNTRLLAFRPLFA